MHIDGLGSRMLLAGNGSVRKRWLLQAGPLTLLLYSGQPFAHCNATDNSCMHTLVEPLKAIMGGISQHLEKEDSRAMQAPFFQLQSFKAPNLCDFWWPRPTWPPISFQQRSQTDVVSDVNLLYQIELAQP